MIETDANGVKVGDGKRYIVGDDADGYLRYNSNTVEIYVAHAQPFKVNLGSETALLASANGSVDLYYNNSKKFETTNTGVTVTGTVAATSYTGDGSNLSGINTDLVSDTSPQLGGELDSNGNNINLPDSTGGGSNRIRLGTGNDLQMYHDGSNGYLYNSGSGNLTLVGNGSNRIQIRAKITETNITCNADGNVELYYDNSKKLGTNSGGVEVFGHLQLDDSKYLKLGNSGGTADVQIFHNGSNFHVQHTNAGSAYIDSVGDHIFRHSSTSEYRAAFVNNGSVKLYYDGSEKFRTVSGGIEVTGGAELTGGVTLGGELNLQNSNNSNTDRFIDAGLGDAKALYIRGMSSNASHENLAYFARGGAVGLYYDNSQKIYTQSWGAGITGDVRPSTGALYDLGSSSYRWRNVYTSDLHLSNEVKGANDIDGTWGDWTIQEGESDLFLKNNRSGKKYKFNLMEVS